MKDYGNSVALFGALGCMVLLLVSMHFAKKEDEPEVKDPKPAASQNGNLSAEDSTEPTEGTDVTTGTTVSGESASDISTTTTTHPDTGAIPQISVEVTEEMISGAFIGAVTPEMQSAIDAATKIDPEILHEIYPQELSIVGDSIASGFGAYQVLTNSYDFATGSLAARSITDYTFEYDGASYVYSDALKLSQPAYIYLSMGMNDVNMTTSDEYAENYKNIISTVQDVCPDSVIIVAGITPVSPSSTFTAQTTIQKFNEKLKETVDSIADPGVLYYDAYSAVCDAATGGLRADCDGGDGIHLSYSAYSALLSNLYPMLDEIPAPEKIREMAEELKAQKDAEDTATDENGDGTAEGDGDGEDTTEAPADTVQ